MAERELVEPAGNRLTFGRTPILVARDQNAAFMIILSPIGLLIATRPAPREADRGCRRRNAPIAPAAPVNQAALPHSREIGRTLLPEISFFRRLMSSFALDLADRLIAVPQDLQAELEFVLHLVEHVAECFCGRPQGSTMSSRVLKIVDDIGMTVCSRITVSFTRSCARTFWRVGRALRAARPRRRRPGSCSALCTSDGSAPMPIGPKRAGRLIR